MSSFAAHSSCNFSKSFIHAFRIWVLLLSCGNITISNFLKVVNYYPIQPYCSKLVNLLQIPQPESNSFIFEPWVPYLNHSAHPEPFYPDRPCFLVAHSSSFLGSYHLASHENCLETKPMVPVFSLPMHSPFGCGLLLDPPQQPSTLDPPWHHFHCVFLAPTRITTYLLFSASWFIQSSALIQKTCWYYTGGGPYFFSCWLFYLIFHTVLLTWGLTSFLKYK